MKYDADRSKRFDEVAGQYATDLYRYALWLCGQDALAKDLVQETFLRAWRALDSLKNPAAAKGWLITILRREFARTFERKVPKFTELDKVMVADEPDLGPDEQVGRHQIREGIMRLPAKYREPLMLQIVMGFSCEEIASQLGLTKSAVMTQLFRAREKLKRVLHEDGVTGKVYEIF